MGSHVSAPQQPTLPSLPIITQGLPPPTTSRLQGQLALRCIIRSGPPLARRLNHARFLPARRLQQARGPLGTRKLNSARVLPPPPVQHPALCPPMAGMLDFVRALPHTVSACQPRPSPLLRRKDRSPGKRDIPGPNPTAPVQSITTSFQSFDRVQCIRCLTLFPRSPSQPSPKFGTYTGLGIQRQTRQNLHQPGPYLDKAVNHQLDPMWHRSSHLPPRSNRRNSSLTRVNASRVFTIVTWKPLTFRPLHGPATWCLQKSTSGSTLELRKHNG